MGRNSGYRSKMQKTGKIEERLCSAPVMAKQNNYTKYII